MIRGKIFFKNKIVEAGIEVENGVIKRLSKLVKGKEVKGLILPAAIDVHVHFRDFEEKHKETIETGSLSALHGGVCLVIDQPNTKPLVDDFEEYNRRMKIAEKRSFVDYSLNLALTKKNVTKINEIVEKVKEKYHLPAVGEVFLQSFNEELQMSYDDLKSIKHKVTLHAEDPEFVEIGHPNFLFRKREAEIVAVKKCLEIGKFHFCHISTREAAEILSRSDSTFEVSPHHLLLSIEDRWKLGNMVNVNPPLRSKEDSSWLLKNFEEIDVLASDHAPHTVEEKLDGAAGFPGVETTYPMFIYLASVGFIKLETLVEKFVKNPAKIFGFEKYGEIEVGKFANFAVFDLKDVETIKASKLHSKCNWTPYEDFKAIFPKEVYIRGEEAKNCSEALGKVLRKD
ncbi:MAG: dihydroorotase [Archaeoglobaceae archaeon]|nr:dihydroorotase [Archaeoglobaceae archaeon]MCX8152036.1 dihydroorotase [Archaeoglobaceae archaeon]MDW8013593.1 dihydroorotase [Archaeoglobaceae archaeon]